MIAISPTIAMAYSFNLRHFLILVLVLGLQLHTISCDDDEDAAHQEPDREADEPNNTETVKEDEAMNDPEVENCHNPSNETKKLCCKNNDLVDEAIVKCYLLHQKKAPKEDEKDLGVLVKFFSCLIECTYKSKKYIAKGDTLNMKMIESDAKKKFKNNEKEMQYMIEMYEHCERKAKVDWHDYKKNPAARIIFSGACKPYYTLVFMCIAGYSNISCPYFKWTGTTESKETCGDMRKACEHLLGDK